MEPLESLAAIKIEFCQIQESQTHSHCRANVPLATRNQVEQVQTLTKTLKNLIRPGMTENLPGKTFDAVIEQTLEPVVSSFCQSKTPKGRFNP